MPPLTADQVSLVEEYNDYSIEDLYNLIGNQVADLNNPELNKRYVLGTPNVFRRGEKIVEDARLAVCRSREHIEKAIKEHSDTLEPLEWVGTLADVILAVTVTQGIPPWAVAVALGKLCNRTLSKLCPAESH